jgi:hypothetical protein
MVNPSHTIKDKEIPQWQPLQRVHRFALIQLSSHKRFLLLLFAVLSLLFLLKPRYTERIVALDERIEGDAETLLRICKDFRALSSLHSEFSSPSAREHTAVFITAHDLYNATGLTMLACEMAAARKMNVLMLYVGRNSEGIPFFLRANQFDRVSSCPMTWFDARHEYSSLSMQEMATETVLREVISSSNPSVVISLDDDEDWFVQSLKQVVHWSQPRISSIQLKRSAIPDLHWITTLGPSALAGTVHALASL